MEKFLPRYTMQARFLPRLQVPIEAKRISGVISKLNYAEELYKEIGKAIWGTYREELPIPRYLEIKAANLLAEIVECFDHLALDLVETSLLPLTSEKIKDLYEQGKILVYFPFYASQLAASTAKPIFKEFESLRPDIFNSFKAFVEAMDTNQMFPNTIIPANILREAKGMVNEKKHSKVIGVESHSEGRIFLQGGQDGNSMSVAFDPVNEDGSKNAIRIINRNSDGSHTQSGTSKVVATYKFENGQEVLKFCLFALGGARRGLHHFYTKYFDEAYGDALLIPATAGSSPVANKPST